MWSRRGRGRDPPDRGLGPGGILSGGGTGHAWHGHRMGGDRRRLYSPEPQEIAGGGQPWPHHAGAAGGGGPEGHSGHAARPSKSAQTGLWKPSARAQGHNQRQTITDYGGIGGENALAQ